MVTEEYDVICVGAGFGSIATLARLRKQGLSVKIIERGASAGGIWYWNCYPGARVDSDAPIYQMFDKDIWEGFTFQERYPGWRELRQYFDYLEKKLKISEHTKYNCAVTGAHFDESKNKWEVLCADGTKAYCRYFIPSIGFASRTYKPQFPGLEKFKGVMHHTGEWPQEDVDLKGKRVAVIGTGSSGVQVIQESGRDAAHLTAYQRTPNYALPMIQKKIDKAENDKMKQEGGFEKMFELCHHTFGGMSYDTYPKSLWDETPEERRKLWHRLIYEQGGFRFWLGNYDDMFKDEKANTEIYNYWKETVRARIKDPKKADILAPHVPPHPWGTKRPSLEQYYYEIYNLPHVDLVDLSSDPIVEFTETGIRTESGHQEFDVIVLATGFNTVHGTLAALDIRGVNGESLSDHWKDGVTTAYGIALHGFPNMFFLYGPQAPTAFSNGPTCVQVQAEWLDRVVKEIKEKGITRIEATREQEIEWSKRVLQEWNDTLFPKAKSWYQGSNIPGAKVQPLNWAGGMPEYIRSLDKSIENNFHAWTVSTAA